MNNYIEETILEICDNQESMTRSDLQGLVEAEAMKIVTRCKEEFTKELDREMATQSN